MDDEIGAEEGEEEDAPARKKNEKGKWRHVPFPKKMSPIWKRKASFTPRRKPTGEALWIAR
jgi:hypothetical protein